METDEKFYLYASSYKSPNNKRGDSYVRKNNSSGFHAYVKGNWINIGSMDSFSSIYKYIEITKEEAAVRMLIWKTKDGK